MVSVQEGGDTLFQTLEKHQSMINKDYLNSESWKATAIESKNKSIGSEHN